MPDRLPPALIRGARGVLDWSMTDLARAACLSVSTVKRAEDGAPQPVSDEAHGLMRTALEAAGVLFLPDDGDGPGLRLRRSGAPDVRPTLPR